MERRSGLRAVGWLALAIAVAGLISAALGGPGMYLAIGLGIAGGAAGWVGYRRAGDPGAARLAGAGAITVGILAVGLGGLRYGLTLAAVSRLEALF
jgi:hypothetical protein